MRVPLRIVAALLSALGGAGACGPVTQQADVVAPLSAPIAAPKPARVRWAPNPLPLPENALVVGRWNEPRRLLARLQAGAPSDASIEPWLRARLGSAGRALDLGAPVEFLVALEPARSPTFRWLLSFPLEARGEPAFREGPRDVASPLGWACAETSALGPAPLRMVCSSDDDDLSALLDTATRALPFAPVGPGEVGLSLRAQALAGVGEPVLRSWVSSWLLSTIGATSASPGFDAPLGALVESLTRESFDLARDLDGASLQLSPGADGSSLALSLIAPASNRRSLLGQLVAGSGAGGLAPLDFWQLSNVSDGAGFLWVFEAALLERWRLALSELIFAVLDFRGVPDRLRVQARALLRTLPVPRGPLVHARGELPARRAGDPQASASLSELGWARYEVRGNFAEYRAYAAELARAFDDPVLGAQLGRLLRSAFGERWGAVRMRQRSPMAAARLPRGSFTLEVSLAPPRVEAARADDGAGAGTLFIVFVPDAEGVEISWGADEAFLVALLAEPARGGSSSTLATRADLATLQRERALGGGFFSLERLARIDTSAAASLLGMPSFPAARQLLERAPHRGRSPIVYSLSRPAAGAGLALNASLRREAVEDLVFLFASAFAEPAVAGAGSR